MRILIVEDDPMLGEGLQVGLRQAGFHPEWVKDGEAAWQILRHETFSAVVLDLGLPKLDGLEVLKRARANEQKLPVLVLTARDTAQDVIDGLDSGADDYMVKPCDLGELAARLRALIRRAAGAAAPIMQVGQLTLDPASRDVRYEQKEVELSPRE
ncbi:MAG: response regulator transcription factor, partial [Fluviibacter sp.]